MPTIYEYFGIVFKFFSDEHEPIHVHVQRAGKEAVFELIIQNGKLVEIRQRETSANTLSERDTKTARRFVEKYADNIVEKWVNFFIYRKKVRLTKITQKI
jgi:hypothetical protein